MSEQHTPDGSGAPVPVLSAHRVIQDFGSTRALAGVDFGVSAGEIVGLAGANGAGKSTLIGILSGALTPTAGELRVDGVPVSFDDPEDAARAGIATVQQDVDAALVPTLTVAENLVLDRIARRSSAAGSLGAFPSRRAIRRAAADVLGDLDLDLDAEVSRLRTSDKQQLLIARALHRGARVLFLDEPTAALSIGEQQHLHDRVRALAAAGTAIVYITHHLGELVAICSRVVTLRDGVVAGEFVRPLDREAIVTSMLGALAARQVATRSGAAAGDPRLRATGVRTRADRPALDLEVRPGEVLGITGPLGAGKSELLRQFAGADPLLSGALEFDGAAFLPRHPADAARVGIGFVAEDRRQTSEFPDWDIAGNIAIGDLRGVRRGPLLSARRERSRAAEAIDRLRIVASGPRARLTSLSGGNRQKVIVARWLVAGSRLLVLDEPFRGVDLGARADLAALLRSGAAGAAIVAASDPEEILEVADRILVLVEGRIVAEVRPADVDAAALSALMLAVPETS